MLADLQPKVFFNCSKLPGSGPIFPDRLFENGLTGIPPTQIVSVGGGVL